MKFRTPGYAYLQKRANTAHKTEAILRKLEQARLREQRRYWQDVDLGDDPDDVSQAEQEEQSSEEEEEEEMEEEEEQKGGAGSSAAAANSSADRPAALSLSARIQQRIPLPDRSADYTPMQLQQKYEVAVMQYSGEIKELESRLKKLELRTKQMGIWKTKAQTKEQFNPYEIMRYGQVDLSEATKLKRYRTILGRAVGKQLARNFRYRKILRHLLSQLGDGVRFYQAYQQQSGSVYKSIEEGQILEEEQEWEDANHVNEEKEQPTSSPSPSSSPSTTALIDDSDAAATSTQPLPQPVPAPTRTPRRTHVPRPSFSTLPLSRTPIPLPHHSTSIGPLSEEPAASPFIVPEVQQHELEDWLMSAQRLLQTPDPIMFHTRTALHLATALLDAPPGLQAAFEELGAQWQSMQAMKKSFEERMKEVGEEEEPASDEPTPLTIQQQQQQQIQAQQLAILQQHTQMLQEAVQIMQQNIPAQRKAVQLLHRHIARYKADIARHELLRRQRHRLAAKQGGAQPQYLSHVERVRAGLAAGHNAAQSSNDTHLNIGPDMRLFTMAQHDPRVPYLKAFASAQDIRALDYWELEDETRRIEQEEQKQKQKQKEQEKDEHSASDDDKSAKGDASARPTTAEANSSSHTTSQSTLYHVDIRSEDGGADDDDELDAVLSVLQGSSRPQSSRPDSSRPTSSRPDSSSRVSSRPVSSKPSIQVEIGSTPAPSPAAASMHLQPPQPPSMGRPPSSSQPSPLALLRRTAGVARTIGRTLVRSRDRRRREALVLEQTKPVKEGSVRLVAKKSGQGEHDSVQASASSSVTPLPTSAQVVPLTHSQPGDRLLYANAQWTPPVPVQSFDMPTTASAAHTAASSTPAQWRQEASPLWPAHTQTTGRRIPQQPPQQKSATTAKFTPTVSIPVSTAPSPRAASAGSVNAAAAATNAPPKHKKKRGLVGGLAPQKLNTEMYKLIHSPYMQYADELETAIRTKQQVPLVPSAQLYAHMTRKGQGKAQASRHQDVSKSMSGDLPDGGKRTVTIRNMQERLFAEKRDIEQRMFDSTLFESAF